MVFQCINICQVLGLGFQHLPRDQAKINAWKNMFDPYKATQSKSNTGTTAQERPVV